MPSAVQAIGSLIFPAATTASTIIPAITVTGIYLRLRLLVYTMIDYHWSYEYFCCFVTIMHPFLGILHRSSSFKAAWGVFYIS